MIKMDLYPFNLLTNAWFFLIIGCTEYILKLFLTHILIDITEIC